MQLPEFDDGRDDEFEFREIEIAAIFEGKELADALEDAKTTKYKKFVVSTKKARVIIVNALGEKPIRVVQSCELLSNMWAELHERYSEGIMANQIIVHSALMNLKLEKGKHMGDYVPEMELLVNRLERMDLEIKETMQVAILLVSLSLMPGYTGNLSPIKTLESTAATCSNVTMRIIE